MGQILHGSARTTEAVRRAMAKWKGRDFVHDAKMGPKQPRSTSLSPEEEAIVVAFLPAAGRSQTHIAAPG